MKKFFGQKNLVGKVVKCNLCESDPNICRCKFQGYWENYFLISCSSEKFMGKYLLFLLTLQVSIMKLFWLQKWHKIQTHDIFDATFVKLCTKTPKSSKQHIFETFHNFYHTVSLKAYVYSSYLFRLDFLVEQLSPYVYK